MTHQTARKFGYVFIFLLAILFKANNVPQNTSQFPTNPVNPQPVPFMQNSEILSWYLSSYSVEPQKDINFHNCPPLVWIRKTN
jgi:hypothetical protein